MTPTPPESSSTKKSGWLGKSLTYIEAIGNRLPDPLTLFLIFSLVVIAISAIASLLNVSVVHPGNGKTITAVSLVSPDGIRKIVTGAVTNFTEFPPLGTVIVAMLGVGVAEATGLLSALLRQLVLIAPRWLISPTVVFAGVMSNIAADAGYVVLVPLGAIVFLAFKRHPLAGMAAAFAGVSGGFSANLLLSPLQILLRR